MRRHLLPIGSILFLLCSSVGLAQVSATGVAPRLIRYSATLQGNSNETGAVGVTFSIYRSQFDGAPLWSEIQNVQADKKGDYSVLLGSTRNEGLPMELFDAAETRWLEVEVNGSKQTRLQIGSVPYAMLSANAQTLGGLPPSAFLRVDARAGSGAATDRLVSPAVSGALVRPQAISGSGGYLAVFTNSTDLGNSALFQSGNTVTIGGTTSLGAITLMGNTPGGDAAGIALYNAGGGAGASVSLDMYNTSFNSGIPQAKIKAVDDGAYSDNLTFSLKNPGAATNALAERMRITSTGNVGIGTTTPGSKLDVAGNVKISGTGNGITFPDGSNMTTALVTPNGGTTNTALGKNALTSNGTGYSNTASGSGSLQSNTAGNNNTADGYNALQANSIGGFNTAVGAYALGSNTTGSNNTATGYGVLTNNTSGFENTGTGLATLQFNSTGSYNTAHGSSALAANISGSYNTALGHQSAFMNTIGNDNVAFGLGALGRNTSGSYNTALGTLAGLTLATGSYNIEVGNQGTPSDDHIIRIGDVQTQTFIAGITGVNVSGVPVVISSSGQLGIASSSRRFKENIQDMGNASEKLMRLHPVTYNYKEAYKDGSKPLDYGLIAEEVAEVYPDLVARSQDGKIQTVMYQKLTPMLLNEVQRLRAQNAAQDEALRALEKRLERLESRP